MEETTIMITKPLLAGKAPADLAQLKYPGLCTPKIDGIRALLLNGNLVSRSFKTIPNHHIRDKIERAGLPDGLDGELVTYYMPGTRVPALKSFNDLSGDIRRADGEPIFKFMVFDYVQHDDLRETYASRMRALTKLDVPPFITKIIPATIATVEELAAFEAKCLADGFEGCMWRRPDGPYKCGRSSTKEEILLKIKRFEDSEAIVTGYEEMFENQNFATKDAFGRTKRSTHAERMVPKGTLGMLFCRTEAGVSFGLGTGYDQAARDTLWARRDELIGKMVKYRHQPSGAKDKPRFPVFLGLRDSFDIL